MGLSQIPTSRPLKHNAALGKSFTANDTISGVLEQEPDMGLFDFHTEEPVEQHAAPRDDECFSAQSEDDCNDRRVPVGVQWLTI